MTRRNDIKASELSGLFIYQDPKKGTIFYDILTRKGYVLTSKDVKKYVLYTSLFPISVLVSIFVMSTFKLSFVQTALVFAGIYLIGAIYARFMFFYKLPVADKWKPFKKESIVSQLANNYSSTRLIILLILLLLLTVMMPIYPSVTEMNTLNQYACYILSGVTAVFAILTIMALIKQKRNG